MTPDFIAASRRFIDVALKQEAPTVQQLLLAVDELALAVHRAPKGEQADSEIDTPDQDYKAFHARIGARFPDLGYYASADPAEVVAEALVGDAIDDIVDIYLELSELIWRYETLGHSDAAWWFHCMYAAHWGLHLRHLALYLHVQIGNAG